LRCRQSRPHGNRGAHRRNTRICPGPRPSDIPYARRPSTVGRAPTLGNGGTRPVASPNVIGKAGRDRGPSALGGRPDAVEVLGAAELRLEPDPAPGSDIDRARDRYFDALVDERATPAGPTATMQRQPGSPRPGGLQREETPLGLGTYQMTVTGTGLTMPSWAPVEAGTCPPADWLRIPPPPGALPGVITDSRSNEPCVRRHRPAAHPRGPDAARLPRRGQSVNLNIPFRPQFQRAQGPGPAAQLQQLDPPSSCRSLASDRLRRGRATADAKGSAVYNKQLSLKRAEA